MTSPASSAVSFDSLGLKPELLRALADKGYTTPTPIQAACIVPVLAGGDVLAAAQTGTGKTAGFALPILQRLAFTAPRHALGVRALILTPTRELAAQIGDSFATYGKHLDLLHTVVFGGVGMEHQIKTLKRGVDIVVATPGRLLDLHQQRAVRLDGVETFVLDEADRMLDMGFIRDIRKLMSYLPKERQNLLFSATFAPEIKALAMEFLKKPKTIEVAPPNTTAERVTHRVLRCDRARKPELLAHVIRKGDWKQVLVFTRTKHGANKVAEKLNKAGLVADAIHGNKSQGARTRALAGFKAGSVRVLVATDIAARGIDIAQLPLVVNYELPNVPEDYVHRIGRTGRAGQSGTALSLVESDERAFLRDIERTIDQEIAMDDEPGFAPQYWSERMESVNDVNRRRQQNRDQSREQGRGGFQRGGFRQDSRGTGRPNPGQGERRAAGSTDFGPGKPQDGGNPQGGPAARPPANPHPRHEHAEKHAPRGAGKFRGGRRGW